MAEFPPEALDNPHDVRLKPSRLPRAVQVAGVALFLIALVVSAGFAVTEHWRRATFTLGTAMIWLALLRLSLDSKILGIFSVRSRRFDTFFSLLLGSGLVFLSASVDALGS